MRATAADGTAESRVTKAVIHGIYDDFDQALRQLIEFAPDGFDAPECGAIVAAYRAARSNGGNIREYLEGDHAATFEIFAQNLEPKAEPPSAVIGDAKRIANRAALQRMQADFARAQQFPSEALQIYQSRSEAPQVSKLPQILDAAAFVAQELPRPIELVSGVLHQGSKLALGGGSKSFKTWTLLDLALSVAYGKHWLTHETKQGNVLYVNFEIQPWSWQSRVRAVAQAKGITIEPGRLSIWNLRGKAADFRTLIPKVIEAAKEKGFALIILDPIYKLYGATDENKAGDVAALLNAIEDLAVQTGAAVAFGAHFSKGNQAGKESIDRISGSGVFARDPDSLLMFTKHETEDAFTVEATLRNFPPVEPFVVRWQPPLMVPDETLDPSKLKQAAGRKPDHLPDDLLKLLPPSGLLTKDWIEAAENEGISRRTFYRLKTALEQSDKIIREVVSQLWKPVKTGLVP